MAMTCVWSVVTRSGYGNNSTAAPIWFVFKEYLIKSCFVFMLQQIKLSLREQNSFWWEASAVFDRLCWPSLVEIGVGLTTLSLFLSLIILVFTSQAHAIIFCVNQPSALECLQQDLRWRCYDLRLLLQINELMKKITELLLFPLLALVLYLLMSHSIRFSYLHGHTTFLVPYHSDFITKK